MDAVLKCERKKHTSGEVPPEWSARLGELQADYDEAVESWRKKLWRNSTPSFRNGVKVTLSEGDAEEVLG